MLILNSHFSVICCFLCDYISRSKNRFHLVIYLRPVIQNACVKSDIPITIFMVCDTCSLANECQCFEETCFGDGSRLRNVGTHVVRQGSYGEDVFLESC